MLCLISDSILPPPQFHQAFLLNNAYEITGTNLHKVAATTQHEPVQGITNQNVCFKRKVLRKVLCVVEQPYGVGLKSG